MRSYISYISPDFGQPLRAQQPWAAHDEVLQFLRTCTTAERFAGEIDLEISEYGRYLSPEFPFESTILRASALFGSGERQLGVRNVDTGEEQHKYTWRLPNEQLPAAVDFFASLAPFGAGFLSPVSLTWHTDFLLLDPDTREMLPYQGFEHTREFAARTSSVMVVLAHELTAMFQLIFPFEIADEAFAAYLGKLLPHLPVRFAWQALRLHRVNRRGSGHIRRKLSESDLAFVIEKSAPTGRSQPT